MGLNGGNSASEPSETGSWRLLSCYGEKIWFKTWSAAKLPVAGGIGEERGGNACLILLGVKIVISGYGDVEAAPKGLFEFRGAFRLQRER